MLPSRDFVFNIKNQDAHMGYKIYNKTPSRDNMLKAKQLFFISVGYSHGITFWIRHKGGDEKTASFQDAFSDSPYVPSEYSLPAIRELTERSALPHGLDSPSCDFSPSKRLYKKGGGRKTGRCYALSFTGTVWKMNLPKHLLCETSMQKSYFITWLHHFLCLLFA